jgi:hypothetical protein
MGGLLGLFGGGGAPKPILPPPPPQIDDATARLNAEDKASRLAGRKSTILTSDSGLPNLGSTTSTGQ